MYSRYYYFSVSLQMKEQNIYIGNQPLAEARAAWHDALTSCGFFGTTHRHRVQVVDALGKRTAEPVYARHSSPSYNAAAMDGIAVHFGELVGASEANPIRLPPDRYRHVNTGNAVFEPFNSVVMIEDIHIDADGNAEIIAPATPWQHVRTVGEDIVATEMIIAAGAHIRPIDQAALLAAGITEIKVFREPRTGVIPTGSDLVAPGGEVRPGDIIEFNSTLLTGYLSQWGAIPKAYPPVPDEPERLREAIKNGVDENDMVVINAGASAGKKDYTAQVLAELGTIVVHGVAIKPGKPVLLAIVDNKPVIGLPGYPISALLTMRLFVREMVYRYLDMPLPAEPEIEAVMSRPVFSTMGVDQFVRVNLGLVGEKLIATPSGKGAGSVMSMVRADALLKIPAGSEGVAAASKVSLTLLRKQAEIEATLVVIGSHDNILDVLANQLHRLSPPVRLSSAHVGSLGGIMAIRRGEAHLAGVHLLDEESGEYNISFIRKFLPELPLRLINLCHRQQGMIVPKGNPKNISSFSDIAEQGHVFINRQQGAGTRLLTDKILRDAHLAPDKIIGYDREEYTHMNVAVAVASGSADAGMGILAAATALDLDFIPVANERYDLICPDRFGDDPRVSAALEVIKNDTGLHKKITALGGYDLCECGTVIYRQP
jgi:putative molybdopterin biosynthesis protein